jgi:hypothetical protein
MPGMACSVVKGLHEMSSASRPAPGRCRFNGRLGLWAQQSTIAHGNSTVMLDVKCLTALLVCYMWCPPQQYLLKWRGLR